MMQQVAGASTAMQRPCLNTRPSEAALHRSPTNSTAKATSRAMVSTRASGPKSDSVNSWIEKNLGAGPVIKQTSVGSSQWATAYTVTTAKGASYFIKTARNRDESMFKGEAMGLQAMYDTRTVRVPQVFHVGAMPGAASSGSFIVMEHLQLGGPPSQEELGRQLALMHLAEPQDEMASKGLFGFPVDNTIGGTPQPNGWMDSWVAFFRERRLRHQLQLANDRHLWQLGSPLLDKLDVFFQGCGVVRPCVLHGDLWSGNIASVGGQPAIYDPATYYGHSEAEFGMSWCAGFNQSFYAAYHKVIPKAPGFSERKDLYTLYHILNHYNLFGSGYYDQCTSIMERLNAKL